MKDFEDKKESRKERKQAQAQDRSKFKKSVRQKHQQQKDLESTQRIVSQNLLRGRVMSIFSEQILVFHEEKTIICTLRGVLKKEFLESKNLVVVGDIVLFALSTPTEGAIWQVEKRQSVLAKASKTKQKEQLIAANLDLVILVAATQDPPFDLAYIDRAIIATLRGGMKPLLVINKIDLGITAFVQECITLYQSLPLPLLLVSTTTGEGIKELTMAMKGLSSVFAGLSGVGKSSLINAIVGSNLKTSEISERNRRGRHTTTRSSLIELATGGFCIDTPGIQNFGLLQLSRQDIDEYFSDIAEQSRGCKFFNCTHSHEPACAVKQAALEGTLSPLRLRSYQELYHEITHS